MCLFTVATATVVAAFFYCVPVYLIQKKKFWRAHNFLSFLFPLSSTFKPLLPNTNRISYELNLINASHC